MTDPTTRTFVFLVQMPCTECGEALILDGPRRQVQCGACDSKIELEPAVWKGVFRFRTFLEELSLVEGQTRGSSMTSGELRIMIRWGLAAPSCTACNAALQADAVPDGSEGVLSCACGRGIPTFPPPEWLREVEPAAVQLFDAARDGPPPSGALSIEQSKAMRPVTFVCPSCGGSLKITTESPRILTCTYCESDVYLPDPLWRTLHPAKKRTPWWVRFRD